MIMDEYLEILAGHVFDHDKLVTYKWLSKELQVHVNMAKQILWKFYERYHESSNIEFTYLLIGTLKDNGIRVEVVRESGLSRAKEKFNKIISEHLYSVHRPLEDLEQLANSGFGDVTYSAIKCNACIERNEEEMYLMRWGTKKTIEENVNFKSMELANHPKIDQKLAIIKKNGFNNLFNMASKPKRHEMLNSIKTEKDNDSAEKDKIFSKDVNTAEENKSTIEKDKGSTKNKDTAENNKRFLKDKVSVESDKVSGEKNKGLIEKSREGFGTKKAFPKREEMKKAEKGNLGSFFEMTSPLKSTEDKITEQKDDKTKKQSPEIKKIKEKEKIRGKKRNRSQESDNITKRRKRIVVQSDSSDSEMQSDGEREEAMAELEDEAKPAKPKSPSPPRIKHENGKRKVLKLVNKTYKDGEYMVTKKEHVYVSCSEDEEEEKKMEPLKVVAKAEKMKKKQTMLTNFFKRS